MELVITSGEPAGIGPDITIQALLTCILPSTVGVCVIGDAQLLAQRAALLGHGEAWLALLQRGQVRLQPLALMQNCLAGKLDPANAPYVLAMLDMAIAGCLQKKFSAMVTAPIQKSTIAAAGVPFSGHTEYLAQHSGMNIRCPHSGQVVMMLMGPQTLRPDRAILRVALATTHIPLAHVASALTCEGLLQTLKTVDDALRKRFRIAKPRILVAGLNPHAGEAGQLGNEEITIMMPAIKQAQAMGLTVQGPLPADTLFQPRYLEQADCVLAMYHDQGLAPLKYATFGEGVNVTLGLPFVRTSVDHGTALDLVGTGKASPSSMLAAINTALELCQ